MGSKFAIQYLKERLAEAEANQDKGAALDCLCEAVALYIEKFGTRMSDAGSVTSDRKRKTSSENGKKGGRPKGSKNKPKDVAKEKKNGDR